MHVEFEGKANGLLELGSSLRLAREAQGLTLADAEKATRVRARYLRALEDGQLTVAFGANDVFLMKKADVAANRTIVADALHEVAGGRWRLDYELRSELDARRSQGGPRTEQEWVKRFMEEFDAEEVPLHLSAGQPAPSGESAEEG